MFLPIGDNIDRRTLPLVPVLLVFANLFVFLIEGRMFAADPSGGTVLEAFVLEWGLVPEALVQGHVLGLVTHMFLHGDLLHIAGNLIVLWAFACSLEIGLGRWSLLGFYLFFGIVGGLAHSLTDLTSTIPLIGASGAIAGLIGAYTVIYGPLARIRTLVFLFIHTIECQIPASAFGIIWVGLQISSAADDVNGASGVAWYAHLGGFAAGVVVGFLCRRDTKCALTQDREGNLVFQDAPAEQATSDSDAPIPDVWPLPPVCPHCRHALSEQSRLTPNLARCSHPTCRRLVYLEQQTRTPQVGFS